MNILVITRSPWRNDNSLGNTCTNLFRNMKDVSFYGLCMRDQDPDNEIMLRNFCISEGQLIRNLTKGTPVGRTNEIKAELDTVFSEQKIYERGKKTGSNLLLFAREALWSIGRWKNQNLINYITEVSPDVIFMPVFNCFYPHKILKFIMMHTDAKLILFHADDNYSLKQFVVSPIYWLYRFNLRRWVRNSVRLSSVNYVISSIQKQEYEKIFKKKCEILTKFADFSSEPNLKTEYNSPLQLVYTGNIELNRWKSLAHIAEVLEEINKGGVKAQLRIYTGNHITDKMNRALNRGESSFVMGSVPAESIARIQSDADILVHVESLDIKNKLVVRQSFSTKIVDYLAAARPILVFGPRDVASIKHLIDNECAIVADTKDELLYKLTKCIDSPMILQELSKMAFLCGKKHHNKNEIVNMIEADFNALCKQK